MSAISAPSHTTPVEPLDEVQKLAIRLKIAEDEKKNLLRNYMRLASRAEAAEIALEAAKEDIGSNAKEIARIRDENADLKQRIKHLEEQTITGRVKSVCDATVGLFQNQANEARYQILLRYESMQILLFHPQEDGLYQTRKRELALALNRVQRPGQGFPSE